jgi:hypothetical protein
VTTRRGQLIENLALRGLAVAPSQVWGGVRLVPLLRENVREDLRLARRRYDDNLSIVSLDGHLLDSGVKYLSYVPHALVVSWGTDGEPAAAFGAQVFRPDGKRFGNERFSARVLHRMAKREDAHRLRMLPLHLAMEGFLALYFEGPDIAWTEYSRHALAHGLSPRGELAFGGAASPGLADALRLFEIHENQVGVLIFVADALGSAFVVSHPDDYRSLHRSLVEDFYGELLWHYGRLPPTGHLSTLAMNDARVSSLPDLRRELGAMRAEWAGFLGFMAGGLFGRTVCSAPVYKAGPFMLQRFMTSLDLGQENHIGEAMVRDDGTLEYLKTYRLSAAQARRAYLLQHLAAHNWNLDATAGALGVGIDALIQRLENAGFAYILHPDIVRASRWRRAKGLAR